MFVQGVSSAQALCFWMWVLLHSRLLPIPPLCLSNYPVARPPIPCKSSPQHSNTPPKVYIYVASELKEYDYGIITMYKKKGETPKTIISKAKKGKNLSVILNLGWSAGSASQDTV